MSMNIKEMDMNSTLDQVLAGLMRRYSERVPDVQKIIQAMIRVGMIKTAKDIENDHIAFRTMGVPGLGIRSLEKIFLHYGYQKRDYYHFEAKKLDAYWYSPPGDTYPRIFASELRVGDLSEKVQGIIHQYTDTVKSDPVDQLDLDDAVQVDRYLHTGLWPLPTLSDYTSLLEASEYAAWVIYNHYYLNHFTISVHNLPAGYNTLEAFDHFLEAEGIKLSSAGGTIKESKDGKLRQSATVAGKIMARFSDGGQKEIAGSYVEFAERKVLDPFMDLPPDSIQRKHRRDGFETGNADKIFESTYRAQTDR
ncbi:protein of unknown function [Arachidicoccus rhizosphaerae]|uniref:2-oxoadipate dioxygenase/decarboxylase n=1 Tax=Arachidicoccus rhizosphaerae TaxID=551991 RepID=A0A1H3WXD5_9BACT|nr:DUF1338 domain-containing protein [Arachidicoccus rhizosphaerae]SDZ91805.1 protein of unknown function [Arachidicoccus rhizosphaerae]